MGQACTVPPCGSLIATCSLDRHGVVPIVRATTTTEGLEGKNLVARIQSRRKPIESYEFSSLSCPFYSSSFFLDEDIDRAIVRRIIHVLGSSSLHFDSCGARRSSFHSIFLEFSPIFGGRLQTKLCEKIYSRSTSPFTTNNVAFLTL